MATRTARISLAGTTFAALLFGLLLATASPARALVAWPEPQDISAAGINSTSPQVAVSSDGRVIAYTWVQANTAFARYSTSSGAEWKTQTLANAASISSPRVAVSDNGAAIAYAWTQSEGATTTAGNTYSQDSGATWNSIELEATDQTSNPQIALSSEGQVIALAWLEGSDKVRRALVVNGATSTATIASVPASDSVSEPRAVVGNDGQTIAFSYIAGGLIKQTFSTNGGTDWQTQNVSDTGTASELSAAASSSGTTIAYAWLSANGGNPVATSRFSFDNGANWVSRSLTTNEQTAGDPQIAASGDGTSLGLAWLVTNPGGAPIARSTYTLNKGTDFKSHTLSAEGQRAGSPKLALSGDSQTMAFSWIRLEGPAQGVVRSRVTNDRAAEWTKQDVSQVGQAASEPDIGLSSDGKTLIETWSLSRGDTSTIQSVNGSFFSLPEPPTGTSAKAGNKSVIVSWNAPANDGGSPITSYRVNAKILGKGWQKLGVTDGPVTSYNATGLKNNKTYKFRVAAKNIGGRGKNSAASSPVTPTATKPGKVQKLSVKWKKKKRKAVVKWKVPASGNAKKYQVRLSKPNNLKQWNSWKAGKSKKRVYTNLTKNKRYKVQVRAKNGKTLGNKKGIKFKTKQSKKFTKR